MRIGNGVEVKPPQLSGADSIGYYHGTNKYMDSLREQGYGNFASAILGGINPVITPKYTEVFSENDEGNYY